MHIASVPILFCFLLILIFLTSQDQSSIQEGKPNLLQTKLTVRSATLVVKDLADEWQLSHYETQPFEFCGKSTLSNRQLKACADHFLSLVAGDGNMKGLPTIPAYDICMNAQNDYQLKSCIWAVSSAVKPDDFISMQVYPDYHLLATQKFEISIRSAAKWRNGPDPSSSSQRHCTSCSRHRNPRGSNRGRRWRTDGTPPLNFVAALHQLQRNIGRQRLRVVIIRAGSAGRRRRRSRRQPAS